MTWSKHFVQWHHPRAVETSRSARARVALGLSVPANAGRSETLSCELARIVIVDNTYITMLAGVEELPVRFFALVRPLLSTNCKYQPRLLKRMPKCLYLT